MRNLRNVKFAAQRSPVNVEQKVTLALIGDQRVDTHHAVIVYCTFALYTARITVYAETINTTGNGMKTGVFK